MGRRAAFVSILAAVAVVAVTAAVPAPARAAAESDDPERLIKRGNDLRRQGDNIRAFGYLQRAHELAGTPRTGAQLGLCEQALGRFADAEAHLTAALSTNDAWVDANRAGLEASRTVARKKLGKVQLTGAPAGTTVAVGNAPMIKLPADGVIWVAPGATALALEAPGFRSATRATQVSEGGTATVAAGLTPVATAAVTPVAATASAGTTPAATPSASATDGTPAAVTASPADVGNASEGPPDDGRSALRITGLAVAGAGVAMVVTGFVLRNMASSKLEAITNDANAMRPYNPANDNWKTYDNSGWALLGVGGAAIVTGAVIYLVNRGDDDPAASSASAAASRGHRADSAFARRLSLGWTPQQGVSLGYAAAF